MSRSVVAAMTAYALELREAEIKLNQNESPDDVPREWKERALARVVEQPWNRYPDFESIGLRGALANAYGLEAENILVGNGSNELLAATIGAFVGPGTPVVLPKPTFALYEKLVTVAGGTVIPVPIDPHTGLLPLDEMLYRSAAAKPPLSKRRFWRRTPTDAVVIVCSPNNPTGGVLPPHGLDALLATGATVLLDEAYADFDDDPSSAASRHLLPARGAKDARGVECPSPREAGRGWPEGPGEGPLHPRLVTFRTFSKAWGLAALRVGWLASTASTCREIRKVKLPYSLNIVSEAIAMTALEDRARRDANVARVIAERARVFAAMQRIDGVAPCPSRANFIFFRVREPRRIFDELCARGVLIREYADALRVSIGTREQNDRFLEALQSCA
jgi:histidinol-phosphate aminotransferase